MSCKGNDILDQLEKNYLINLSIIDMQILIRKILEEHIDSLKKELNKEQIEAYLPIMEDYASRIIQLTETRLKQKHESKEALEEQLEIVGQLFSKKNPQSKLNSK